MVIAERRLESHKSYHDHVHLPLLLQLGRAITAIHEKLIHQVVVESSSSTEDAC
jgi:hypothetical protein